MSSTCSLCKSNRNLECLFREPKTKDGWLCLALTIGGCFLVVYTFGRICLKYRFLKEAKHEWDKKSENKKRKSTTEMKGGIQCLSGAQDYERVDGVESKILSSGKWAWVIKRATEMEQQSKSKIEMRE